MILGVRGTWVPSSFFCATDFFKLFYINVTTQQSCAKCSIPEPPSPFLLSINTNLPRERTAGNIWRLGSLIRPKGSWSVYYCVKGPHTASCVCGLRTKTKPPT